MTMDRRATLVLLFACSLCSPGRAALASEPEAGAPVVTDEAKQGFEKGVALYKAGDYAGALAEFLTTYKAKPHYSVLYNIAQCHAMLDHNAEALGYYITYLEEGADYVAEARRKLVLSEIERLKGLLCKLTLDVEPEGAFVIVDGKLVGKAPIKEVQYLDPGEHSIMVQKDGWTSATRTIVMKREKPETLDIDLQIVITPGKIVVESKVEGSIVVVDGVEVGAAPWKGDVEAGTHVVALKGPGDAAAEEKVDVGAGETLKLVLDPVVPAAAVAGPEPTPKANAKKQKPKVKTQVKAKKIGPGPFAGAAGAAVAGVVVAAVVGALDGKNHDEYMDFRDDVLSGAFTGTEEDALARQKDYADEGKGLNAGFVAGLTLAAAGVVAAAVLAPFTDWKGKKKVEVQSSGTGVLVTVSF